MQRTDYQLDIALLKKAISDKGFTPTELAFMAGVSASALSAWLNQRRKPTVNAMKKMCDALGLTVDELLIPDDENALAA